MDDKTSLELIQQETKDKWNDTLSLYCFSFSLSAFITTAAAAFHIVSNSISLAEFSKLFYCILTVTASAFFVLLLFMIFPVIIVKFYFMLFILLQWGLFGYIFHLKKSIELFICPGIYTFIYIFGYISLFFFGSCDFSHLKEILTGVRRKKKIFLIEFISFCCFFFLFSCLVVNVLYFGSIKNSFFYILLMCCYVFVFIWSVYVCNAIVHTTIAGFIASEMFSREMSKDPIFSALKRSLTVSLGSLCKGAFRLTLLLFFELFAIIFSLLMLFDKNGLPARGSEDVLLFVYCIYEKANEPAYTFVSLYGTSYNVAAKKTFLLLNPIKSASKNALNSVKFFNWIICMSFAALSPTLYMVVFEKNNILLFLVGLYGLLVFNVLFEIFKSAVITGFVCQNETLTVEP